MSKQKMPNSPATMRDVFSGTEAALGFAGVVMARAIPLFVRYPITDLASLERLQQELEKLSDEFDGESPYSGIVLDALIHTLETERTRILAAVGSN